MTPTPEARVNLALSLLNHRSPSEHTVDLAIRALQGATVEELMTIETAG